MLPFPGKGSKNKKPSMANKPLTKKEIRSFAEHTGLGENEIKILHDRFMANNPDGRLDRNEFRRLYAEIRPEPSQLLDEISDFVFRAFDTDRNGNEPFVVAMSFRFQLTFVCVSSLQVPSASASSSSHMRSRPAAT